jgi:hypothetical protein
MFSPNHRGNPASKRILLILVARRVRSCSCLLLTGSNARAILADYRRLGEALWDRFKGGKEGTLWYYRSLVGVYRQAGSNTALVDELARVVAKIEQFASATAAPMKEHGEP